jgi:hypothetical protein
MVLECQIKRYLLLNRPSKIQLSLLKCRFRNETFSSLTICKFVLVANTRAGINSSDFFTSIDFMAAR